MNELTKFRQTQEGQVAITLEYNGFDANGCRIEFNELNLRFEDIQNAKVGDIFFPETGNLQNYDLTTVEIISKTNKDAIIKVYEEKLGEYYFEESELFHILFD